MEDLKPDPRKAESLEAAAKNPDGTFNGARALAWLSEVLKRLKLSGKRGTSNGH
jgi:hypothetical protein